MSGEPFDYVGIDILGSGYSRQLCRLVESDLRGLGFGPVIARGQHGPAAGSEIVANIFAVLSSLVAPAAVSWTVGKLLDSLKAFMLENIEGEALIHRITIRLAEYDIILLDTSFCHNDCVSAEDPNGLVVSEELLRSIDCFVAAEASKGRPVNAITLPCYVYFKGRKLVCTPGMGDKLIWLVDYSDGPQWPFAVYDSANMVFIDAEVETGQ